MPSAAGHALGDGIQRRLDEIKLTLGDTLVHQRCIELLTREVSELRWPGLTVSIVGSLATGLACQGSTVDVLVSGETRPPPDPTEVLPALEERLARAEGVDNVRFHDRRPACLRFRFGEDLSAVVYCGFQQAEQTTWLLLDYATIHPDFCNAVFLLKAWARARGLIGEARSQLSGLTVTLMAIYYMQVTEGVGLPCLSVDAVSTAASGAAGRQPLPAWDLQPSLFDLVRGFFEFYSKFEAGSEAVSVRLGRRLQRPPSRPRRFQIEDPFDPDRNLTGDVKKADEKRLFEVIRHALICLEHGDLPPGLAPRSPATPPSWANQHVATAVLLEPGSVRAGRRQGCGDEPAPEPALSFSSESQSSSLVGSSARGTSDQGLSRGLEWFQAAACQPKERNASEGGEDRMFIDAATFLRDQEVARAQAVTSGVASVWREITLQERALQDRQSQVDGEAEAASGRLSGLRQELLLLQRAIEEEEREPRRQLADSACTQSRLRTAICQSEYERKLWEVQAANAGVGAGEARSASSVVLQDERDRAARAAAAAPPVAGGGGRCRVCAAWWEYLFRPG